MKNYSTVLFDLDGTLLTIEMNKFLKIYFKALTENFSDLAPADKLIKILMSATEKMIINPGQQTNEEVFKNEFFAQLKVDNIETTMKRFYLFYKEQFPELNRNFQIDKETPGEIVGLFKENGYQIILATNPIFPKVAIIERLNWVGLDPADFSFISSYEIMHAAKPQLAYYQEIVDKANLNPECCIMVGNNAYEDMIASKLGMKTMLVNDYLIESDKGDFTPDWSGSMLELREYLAANLG